MSEKTVDVEIVDPELKGSISVSRGLFGPYKIENDHFEIPASAIDTFNEGKSFKIHIPEGFYDDVVDLPVMDAQKPVAAINRKAARKLDTEEYDESIEEYREAVDDSKVMPLVERTSKE